MLAALARGESKHVLAYASGRLTRRPREHEEQISLAENHGVQYLFSKSPEFDLNTAAGRGTARILAATDAMEAEHIGERVSRAKMGLVDAGKWRGGSRPTGYERGGMVLRPDEAKRVADAVEHVTAGGSIRSVSALWNRVMPVTGWTKTRVLTTLHANPAGEREAATIAALNAGTVTLPEVVREWIDRRIPVPGGKWVGSTVLGVLRNPRIAGLNCHNGQIMGPAAWPAIITADQYAALTAVLNPRKKGPNMARRSLKWIGSGLYQCGAPGCVGGLLSSAQGGRGAPAYRCRNSAHLTVSAEGIDLAVRELAIAILERDGVSLLRQTGDSIDFTHLQNESVSIRARLDGAAEAYAAGDFDIREWRKASMALKARLTSVEAELSRVTAASVHAGVADAPSPRAAFLAASIDRQRAIVTDLMQVVVKPACGRWGKPADRLTVTPRREAAA
jgi:hypothetical protein